MTQSTLGSGIRLAVFDCDGTLVDGQHGIIEAMTEAFRAERMDDPEPATVRRIVGLPLAEAIVRLAPRADDRRRAAIGRQYRDAFKRLRQSGRHHEPLFPGAVAALDRLTEAGFQLGIATGKSRQGLQATLESHGLLRRFATLKTSDDGPGKPSPHMLFYAMADIGADPAATVMIGDTVFDMEMAQSARVASIGVAWGYHESAELAAAGAAAVAQNFGELPRLVEETMGRTSCVPVRF
jgi:phosphoglycolate phosphatase